MLLRSQLDVPCAPDHLTARARLAGTQRLPLTVIHAAAGHGRTALALQLLASQGGLHARVTLDRLDNDPLRFWTHVAGAVRDACPQACAGVAGLLASRKDFRVADMLARLVDDLAALPTPLTLVLDDFHRVGSREVIADLDRLLDLVPDTVRVVVITRVRPDLRLCGIAQPRQPEPSRPPGCASDGGGSAALSRREVELLRSVQRGLSDKEIGALLSISTGTVKTHLRNIFRKLGARNRVHALALFAHGPPEDGPGARQRSLQQ